MGHAPTAKRLPRCSGLRCTAAERERRGDPEERGRTVCARDVGNRTKVMRSGRRAHVPGAASRVPSGSVLEAGGGACAGRACAGRISRSRHRRRGPAPRGASRRPGRPLQRHPSRGTETRPHRTRSGAEGPPNRPSIARYRSPWHGRRHVAPSVCRENRCVRDRAPNQTGSCRSRGNPHDQDTSRNTGICASARGTPGCPAECAGRSKLSAAGRAFGPL